MTTEPPATGRRSADEDGSHDEVKPLSTGTLRTRTFTLSPSAPAGADILTEASAEFRFVREPEREADADRSPDTVADDTVASVAPLAPTSKTRPLPAAVPLPEIDVAVVGKRQTWTSSSPAVTRTSRSLVVAEGSTGSDPGAETAGATGSRSTGDVRFAVGRVPPESDGRTADPAMPSSKDHR